MEATAPRLSRRKEIELCKEKRQLRAASRQPPPVPAPCLPGAGGAAPGVPLCSPSPCKQLMAGCEEEQPNPALLSALICTSRASRCWLRACKRRSLPRGGVCGRVGARILLLSPSSRSCAGWWRWLCHPRAGRCPRDASGAVPGPPGGRGPYPGLLLRGEVTFLATE